MAIPASQHFDEVNGILPRLWLASYMGTQNETKLRELGITHILSLYRNPNQKRVKGCQYQDVEIEDVDHADILRHFPACLKFIEDTLSEDKKNQILVHCAQGISRSATIILAYLIKHSHMKPEDALVFLKSKRSCVEPNVGFMQQLEKFHQELYPHEYSMEFMEEQLSLN